MLINSKIVIRELRRLDNRIIVYSSKLSYIVACIDFEFIATGDENGNPNDWILIFHRSYDHHEKIGICGIHDIINYDRFNKCRTVRFTADHIDEHLKSLLFNMYTCLWARGSMIYIVNNYPFQVVNTRPFYILHQLLVNIIHIRKQNGPWPIVRNNYCDVILVSFSDYN